MEKVRIAVPTDVRRATARSENSVAGRLIARSSFPMLLPLAAADVRGSIVDALQRLAGTLQEMLGGLRAEVSFLPPGTAPLIMIFGGLSVLAIALVLSLLPRASPSTAGGPIAHMSDRRASTMLTGANRTAFSSPGAASASHGSTISPPGQLTPLPGAGRTFADGHALGKALTPADIDTTLDAAERLGLGETHLVSVEPHRFVVRFIACQTCKINAGAGGNLGGCEFERGFLEGAARNFLPGAIVEEGACRRTGHAACEFTTHSGG